MQPTLLIATVKGRVEGYSINQQKLAELARQIRITIVIV